MSQEYTPVTWVDETATEPGTPITKSRLDQMQTAHHYADGFEEVDAVPSADPGVDYHKVVYCTADSTFYRWDGTQWTKDIDDDTKALLLAHEADHANPHVVTKAQVGLGNVDNKASVSAWQSTPDNDHIPTEKLVKDSLDGKVDIVTVSSGIKFYGQGSGGPAMYQGTSGATTGITSIPLRDSSGRIKTAAPSANEDAANKKYVDDLDALAMHLTQTGNVNLTGNLTITGDITQNGSAYETHAEKIYTTNDYIITRDGATGALASGDYSGFQVKKYDGTNDGRLVIDNTGTARVGDVGDEQPLLTRSESANLTDSQLFKWDAANSKAVGETVSTTLASGSSAPITSGGVYTAIHNKNQVLTPGSIACTTSRGTDAYVSLVSATTYPYRGEYAVTGLDGSEFASVVFAEADATSGNYAPVCVCDTGKVVIFSKTSATASVPSVMIERDL